MFDSTLSIEMRRRGSRRRPAVIFLPWPQGVDYTSAMPGDPSDSHLPLPAEDMAELRRFCTPGSDRFAVLKQSMERRQIPFETIPIGEARHLALPVPNASKLDGEYYRVTLVAHYDRVPGDARGQ